MNVLIAPDKFKGTLTASEVCDAIEKGLKRSAIPMNIRKFPLADGGEGTLEIFLWHTRGNFVEVTVLDPLLRPIKAVYGLSHDRKTAFIEMARASGLNLLQPDEYNPLRASSIGTGNLMVDALNRNVDRIIIGIGGTATTDAGVGAAMALGIEMLDEDGQPFFPVGRGLQHVYGYDDSKLNPCLNIVKLTAICDVTNPFYGEHGAACVYASQKGASLEEVAELDKGLRQICKVIQQKTGIDLQQVKGSGAGGGFAGGVHALLGAELQSGTEVIFEMTGFDKALKWADVVITGEGKLDRQTLQGKLVEGVARKAFTLKKKVIAVCGHCEISAEEWRAMHLHSVHSLTDYAGDELAMERSAEVLEAMVGNKLRSSLVEGF